MLTREQIDEIHGEAREKGTAIKALLKLLQKQHSNISHLLAILYKICLALQVNIMFGISRQVLKWVEAIYDSYTIPNQEKSRDAYEHSTPKKARIVSKPPYIAQR